MPEELKIEIVVAACEIAFDVGAGYYFLKKSKNDNNMTGWLSHNEIGRRVLSTVAFCFAIIAAVGAYFHDEGFLLAMMMLPASIYLILIDNADLFEKLICKQQVRAVCVGLGYHYARRGGKIAGYPILEYVYNGERYQSEPTIRISLREFEDYYKEKQSYTVLIDEKNPETCCLLNPEARLDKSISFGGMFFAIVSISMFFVF